MVHPRRGGARRHARDGARPRAVAAPLRRRSRRRGANGSGLGTVLQDHRRARERPRAARALRRVETSSLSARSPRYAESRQSFAARHRPHRASSHPARSPQRVERKVGPPALRLSRHLSSGLWFRARRGSASRRDGRRRAAHGVDALRRGGARSADGLRQRRQSHACPRHRARARGGRPRGARRGTFAPGAPTAGGERRPRADRRRARGVRRDLGRRPAARSCSTESAARATCAHQRNRAGVFVRAVGAERRPLRAAAGADHDRSERARRAARLDGLRRAAAETSAARARGRGRRAGAGARVRRGAIAAELQSAVARRSGVQSKWRGDAHGRRSRRPGSHPDRLRVGATATARSSRRDGCRRRRLPAAERRRERHDVRHRGPSRRTRRAAARRGDSHRDARLVRGDARPIAARTDSAGDG